MHLLLLLDSPGLDKSGLECMRYEWSPFACFLDLVLRLWRFGLGAGRYCDARRVRCTGGSPCRHERAGPRVDRQGARGGGSGRGLLDGLKSPKGELDAAARKMSAAFLIS
jgi:hypothetical protein